jgi:hypothetical protein
VSFTREEALKYHREMWAEMKKKYGNNPQPWQRYLAKRSYIKEKQHSCINHCYLCEYSAEVGKYTYDYDDCKFCPIDWTELSDEEDPDRGTCLALYKNGYKSIYECAPIDEILALPEREVKE